MRKLNVPEYSATELYDESVSGLTDKLLFAKFVKNRPQIVAAFKDFDDASIVKEWCHLPKAAHGNSNAVIIGDLTKAELVALYDDGVVRSTGKSRKIYDQIKLSAYGECPYCGGSGEMGEEGELGTADHFLPKARFPSYSVLPVNLVPACQVCNRGMGSNFPANPNLQPLHPYLDEPHFFNEKWTTASLREDEDEPVVIDFAVDSPASWPSKDRQRVVQHFADCNLGSRYRSRVPQELVPLISQRKTSLKELSEEYFREHLLVIANESKLPINGWKRTLYCALAASDWFCAREFE